jgi:hypothetical protein
LFQSVACAFGDLLILTPNFLQLMLFQFLQVEHRDVRA